MPSEAPPRPGRLGNGAYRAAVHAFRLATSGAHRAYLWRQLRARRFYARFVRRGDLCFDVGANHGDRTALFLALGARVVAVEPNAACADDLERKFGSDRRFALVRAGLGAAEGSAVLYLGEIDAVSSLSPGWIERARRVPEIARAGWTRTAPVALTTLDRLLRRHGMPDFCKIDVEGYESEVLAGLSRPLPALSFEYTPWRIEPALDCIDRLVRLGKYRFNLSRGETFAWTESEWIEGSAARDRLRQEARTPGAPAGDVYARA
jgi:FkbM family methyltransferase